MKRGIWLAITCCLFTGCSDESQVLLEDIQHHLNHSLITVLLDLVDGDPTEALSEESTAPDTKTSTSSTPKNSTATWPALGGKI